jgi:hypothetical protein
LAAPRRVRGSNSSSSAAATSDGRVRHLPAGMTPATTWLTTLRQDLDVNATPSATRLRIYSLVIALFLPTMLYIVIPAVVVV